MNTILPELSKLRNGDTMQAERTYGVGIDTHSKFIAVCVMLHKNHEIKYFENSFSTSWTSLNRAREWVAKTISENSDTEVDVSCLRYTIESTSTYHFPVMKAFGGKPSVINPLLAGATRRKTDKLDAKAMSYQSITGLWNESFIANELVQELRLLVKERINAQHRATTHTNRINNYILRFGHTLGAMGTIREKKHRAVIEDMCRDKLVYDEAIRHIPGVDYICPAGLPDEAKSIILDLYNRYDEELEVMKVYEDKAIKLAKSLEWETEKGFVPGEELIKNLLTIPFVREFAVVKWLSEIVTPLRFPTTKHIAAFCGCDPSLMVSAGKVTSYTRRKGNTMLHFMLTKAAGVCIANHSEPFGQWGYQMFKRYEKGGYKKACGAVARRLAVAFYFCHKLNTTFNYDKYNFFKCEVPDISIFDIGFSARVENLLKHAGILSSKQMKDYYISGKLAGCKGIGKKALNEVDEWIKANDLTKIKNRKDVENGAE